jgi:catechol 2,3-dioxygenase-like lactoylglutathione lyase family enzyme
MITHVGNVSIYVRDQQKAVEFYRDKLGFKVLRDEPMGPNARWIEVAPQGAKTHLVPFTRRDRRAASAHFPGLFLVLTILCKRARNWPNAEWSSSTWRRSSRGAG